VQWYRSLSQAATTDIPIQAHRVASALGAGAAARSIRSTYTGTLARDLARPRFLGPMHSRVGSSRRYARIEAHGGQIVAHGDYLYIHGRRIGGGGKGTRSTYGGPIVARVRSVYHHGKHWDAAAILAFREGWIRAARALWAQRGLGG
jgi:hypothetical protein